MATLPIASRSVSPSAPEGPSPARTSLTGPDLTSVGEGAAAGRTAPGTTAVGSLGQPHRNAPWAGPSFAEVVRRTPPGSRAPSPPERPHAKRIRILGCASVPAATPSPGLPEGSGAGSPPPLPSLSSRERFELLLDGARAAQPAASAQAWEASLTTLCMQPGHALDAQSVLLLEGLLGLPANVQACVAQCAAELCVRPVPWRERRNLLGAVQRIAEEDGAAGVRELRRALHCVPTLKAKRSLLFTVRTNVPPGTRLHFLRLAESLLQTGDAADLEAVRQAAEACSRPLLPRGRTFAERNVHQPQASSSAPAAAPDMTDEDRELIEALMNAECDRVEQDDDLDSDIEAQGAPHLASASQGSDPLTDLVHHAEPENVQDDEAIALTKEAWQYLGVRYRRDLPEEAIFKLVHAAYRAQMREARHHRGPLAANAFPNQEKEWPANFTKERQRAYVAHDKARTEEVGQAELPVSHLLRSMFAGRADGRMDSVVENDDMSHHLDEEGLTTQQFVSIVWSIMHRRGEAAAEGSEAEARGERERENLRHSFWRGLADNVLVHVRVDKPLRLERLCHNGLAQRMLERFEGYEPFTIHPTRSGQFLCLLGEKFHEDVLRNTPLGEPDAQQLRDFVVSARKAAAGTFSKRRLPFFERELAVFLRRDYEELAEQALADADADADAEA